MTAFEYKYFPVPGRDSGGAELQTDGASLAPALQRQIDLITGNGWEFVGREQAPVERRRWLFLRQTVREEFFVFRRPVGYVENKAPKARPVPAQEPARIRPKRVVRNYFPDRSMPDISVRRGHRHTPLA